MFIGQAPCSGRRCGGNTFANLPRNENPKTCTSASCGSTENVHAHRHKTLLYVEAHRQKTLLHEDGVSWKWYRRKLLVTNCWCIFQMNPVGRNIVGSENLKTCTQLVEEAEEMCIASRHSCSKTRKSCSAPP